MDGYMGATIAHLCRPYQPQMTVTLREHESVVTRVCAPERGRRFNDIGSFRRANRWQRAAA